MAFLTHLNALAHTIHAVKQVCRKTNWERLLRNSAQKHSVW